MYADYARSCFKLFLLVLCLLGARLSRAQLAAPASPQPEWRELLRHHAASTGCANEAGVLPTRTNHAARLRR